MGLVPTSLRTLPPRGEDLSGLPPAWIGVGSFDLFHDEDLTYARRLNDAGIRCAFYLIPGAFHGFDVLFPRANVSRDFRREQTGALREGLGLS